jgi:hypothetical protein
VNKHRGLNAEAIRALFDGENGVTPLTPSLSCLDVHDWRELAMKCGAKNKAGKPCGAAAIGGTKRCVMHSGRAVELGSKGGRRRARFNPEGLAEFTAPKNAADLRDLLAQSIVEIRTGKMDPKLANAVGYVGASYLRALEVSDVETRLEKLERYLEESRRESSKVGVGGNG